MKYYFNKNLKYLRKKAGKNQDTIASVVDVGRTTVSKWEKNTRPDDETIRKLAEFFEVPTQELMFVDLEEKAKQDLNFLRLLPSFTEQTSESIRLFKLAQDIDARYGELTEEELKLLFAYYYGSFSAGLMDAGVNLLKVICRAHMGILQGAWKDGVNIETESVELPFQTLMDEIIERLIVVGNPAGEFYRAFSILCGLTNVEGHDKNAVSREGKELMNSIYSKGNQYAITFMENVNKDYK